jgi:hypothetical protein
MRFVAMVFVQKVLFGAVEIFPSRKKKKRLCSSTTLFEELAILQKEKPVVDPISKWGRVWAQFLNDGLMRV